MKFGYADTPHGQTHYVQDGRGQPVVLLHQAMRSSRSFAPLIPLLAREHTVLAPDLLGCGNSASLPPNARTHDFAESIVQCLDALDLRRCHLFGVHSGATIAAEIAAGWPSRVASLVLFGFLLVEPGVERQDCIANRTALVAKVAETAADGSHLIKQWMSSYRFVTQMWWDAKVAPSPQPGPEVIRFLQGRMLDIGQSGNAAADMLKAVYGYEWEDRLPKIEARTLHIEGGSPSEPVFCRRGDAVAKLIPDCKTFIMDRADANAPEWLPVELAKVLSAFMEEV